MEITAHINKRVKLELLGILNARDERELWEYLQFKNHDVPIYFVGVIENRFEKTKQNNFVIPLKDRSLYLQFEVNNNTKKVYFTKFNRDLGPRWRLIHSFSELTFSQTKSLKDNDLFYNILVSRINATIDISSKDLGDSDIFNIWTNYLQAEEKIINKLNLSKKTYTIKKVISTISDKLIVELDRPFKIENGAGNNISLDVFLIQVPADLS